MSTAFQAALSAAYAASVMHNQSYLPMANKLAGKGKDDAKLRDEIQEAFSQARGVTGHPESAGRCVVTEFKARFLSQVIDLLKS